MSKPKCDHDWQPMDWQEAYPAASGRKCPKCDAYELGWLCDINAPGGVELAKSITESLTRKKEPEDVESNQDRD